MRETFNGITIGTRIRVTGAGRHSRGTVARIFDRTTFTRTDGPNEAPTFSNDGTARMVEYRSDYDSSLRLVPLAQVRVVWKRRRAGISRETDA